MLKFSIACLVIAILLSVSMSITMANYTLASPNSGQGDESFVSQKFLEEDAQVVKPGILPKSFWYWADVFAEEVQYVFSFSDESKLNLLLNNANERLEEMRALSEEGITKYNDDLNTKYEGYIKKAQEMYDKLKKEAPEKLSKYQGDLEKEILRQEYELKRQAKKAPAAYEQASNDLAGGLLSNFKKILDHLSWKKQQISQQRAEMTE